LSKGIESSDEKTASPYEISEETSSRRWALNLGGGKCYNLMFGLDERLVLKTIM